MIIGDARLPERFWSKVRIDADGCWLWAASIKPNGYGQYAVNRRPRYAHRISYEALVGGIGDGLEIDHLCRVRSCVNPNHLEAVTHSVNVSRRPSSRISAPIYCKRGHPVFGSNMRVTIRRDGREYRECRECRADGQRVRKQNERERDPELFREKNRETMRQYRARKEEYTE